jgi:hypothetical protein
MRVVSAPFLGLSQMLHLVDTPQNPHTKLRLSFPRLAYQELQSMAPNQALQRIGSEIVCLGKAFESLLTVFP